MFASSYPTAASSASGVPEEAVTVTRAAIPSSQLGAAEHFTGAVHVAARFQRTAPARIGGAYVTFAPGARTAWHSHPLGQTLFVTDGSGFVQHWGGAVQAIEVGDVVWIPPRVKHWHGATSARAMTHIAIAEALDGKAVDWMELVTDAT
jgi:quercetin dioxygenase-like cupin family protein